MRHSLWILVLLPVLGFANGGPIDQSDIHATGNIQLIENKAISLDEEALQVELEGDYANVRVVYQLKNHGAAQTVSYAFPVDYTNPAYCNDCEELSEEDRARVPPSLGEVAIAANGIALPTHRVVESHKNVTEPPTLRTWTVTTIDFAATEEKVVTVAYRVRNLVNDWLYTKSFKPQYSKRTFTYVLSPSGNWGDGVVRKLTIAVDCSKVIAKGGIIKEISLAGHTSADNVLRWQFDNFNLKKAKNLEIVYDDEARLLSELIANQRFPLKMIPRAQSSSALADSKEAGKYAIDKTQDNDLHTAWCEGVSGPGIGESLTFEIRGGNLQGIGIVNGYTKSSDTYQNNGRIKKLKVAVTFAQGQPGAMPATREDIVEFPQRAFAQLNPAAVASMTDWVLDLGDGFEPPKQVTLTIEEVYPGNKFSDTCISEIFLLGYKDR